MQRDAELNDLIICYLLYQYGTLLCISTTFAVTHDFYTIYFPLNRQFYSCVLSYQAFYLE